jgi:hypothetical protein
MRYKHQGFVLLAVVVTVLMAYACTQNLNIKPVADMTPKEKSLVAMRIYNSQVDSYKAKMALPNLSAAEKKVLQIEYATFERTWPVIKAYDDYVQGITATIDEAVITQINQFLISYRY